MPTYTFRNTKTNEYFLEFMSISEADEFLKNNTDYEQMCGAPLIHSGAGLKKPDMEFREKLQEIKSKHVGSNINTF